MKFTQLAVYDDKNVSVYFLQQNLCHPKNNDLQEKMKRSKGVYVTKNKIKDEQNLVYQLYTSDKLRRYDNKNNFGSQFDSKRDVCTCKSPNRKNEFRCFGGMPKQIYACHGSRGYIDVGVGSVKTIQRRKVKRIYLPEMDDTGVGSSDLSSFVLRRRYPKMLTVSSFYGSKKTSSKCVGGILEYNKGCVIHQKLSPIIHTKSGATSPKRSLIIKRDTDIGSNTIDYKMETTGTQFEILETDAKESFKQEKKELKSVAAVSQNQPKPVTEIKPPVKVSEQTQKNKFSNDAVEDKQITEVDKEVKEHVRTYSSDSLVQHVHNLEIPSDEKSSRTSFPDPMENKLEREYRKMFSTSKSKESKSSCDKPIPEFKSGSILKRRFEALRRGMVKKNESNSKKKDSEIIKTTHNENPAHKDASVTSDPPSLISRSFSNTEKYKAAIKEKTRGKTKTSSHKKDKRSSEIKQPNQNSTDETRVKGMFRLWGKKFNFEDDTYCKRQATPMPSYEKSTKETEKVDKVNQEKEQPKVDMKENKKESKKFFFFKKKSKDKNKNASMAKKDVTAGRCEIKDGIVLKLGDAATPKVKSQTSLEGNKGNITRKAWLRRFMSETIESARSVNIRWNNSLYATSSSTVFELLDSVYKNTNIVFSQSEITTGESSYYKSFTKQVNFVQDIEAWMIPKTIIDRPIRLIGGQLTETPLRQIPLLINSEKDMREKNVECTVSDQTWYIEKSEAFSHKIEVVLHSNNITDMSNKKPSSQYLKIDIPGDFFDTSSDESKQNRSSDEEVYSEKVYKIVEYETNSEIGRTRKPVIELHKRNHHEPKDIKMIVSVKNSKNLESKILETVIKRPTGVKDVVIQGNDENEGQRCDVIGVGIITQRDLREIRKSILKARIEVSDDDSEPVQRLRQKKCEFAESYLQEYYRHWTPFGMDLYPWCASDTQVHSSSEKSLTSLQIFTDGSKSCPIIYDDLDSTIVTPCETAPCKQCPYDEKNDLINKMKKKFKRPSKAKTETEIIKNQRILPKDSLAVFKRRKVNETTCRSQWASYCRGVKDVTVSVPSVQNKCCCSDNQEEASSEDESADTVKCCKDSEPEPSCPCGPKSPDDKPREGILSSKSSCASIRQTKCCDKKKHAVINPIPPCEKPPPSCCNEPNSPSPSSSSGESACGKPDSPADICESPPGCMPAPPPAISPVSSSTDCCKTCNSPSYRETPPAPPPSLASASTKPTPACCKSLPCKKPPSCSCCNESANKKTPCCPNPCPIPPVRSPCCTNPCPTPPLSKKPEKQTKFQIHKKASPTPSACKKPELCKKHEICKGNPEMVSPCPSPPHSSTSSGESCSSCCPTSCKKPESRNNSPGASIPCCPPADPPSISPPTSGSPCCKSSPRKLSPGHKKSSIIPWRKSSRFCCKKPLPPTAKSTIPSCSKCSPISAILSWKKSSPSKSAPCSPSSPCQKKSPMASLLSWAPNSECCKSRSPPPRKADQCFDKPTPIDCKNCCQSPPSPTCGPTSKELACASPTKPESPCGSPKQQPSFDSPESCPPCESPENPIKSPESPKSLRSPCQSPSPKVSPQSSPKCSLSPRATGLSLTVFPCPPQPSPPPKPPKKTHCSSRPCENLKNVKPKEETGTSKCKDIVSSLKNKLSAPLIGSCPLPATIKVPKCGKDCPMKNSKPPNNPDFTKPSDSCCSKPSCELSSPPTQKLSEMACPSKPGISLKMKPVKVVCADDCEAWQTKKDTGKGCSNERVNIRIKETTPSTEEIREPMNLKIQDEDGRTLFERKDYTCENQHKVVGGLYKDPKTKRESTSSALVNVVENEDGKDITSYVSDKSLLNSLEINFKLQIRQGDKTTEINVGNDCDDKQHKASNLRESNPGVFMLNSDGHEVVREIPKNDINIKITLRNFKSKTKNKVDKDKKYGDDFSKKISDKFHTVSTGYSDVEEENENVFSIHRATINLASSGNVSHECSKVHDELPHCSTSSFSTVGMVDVTEEENFKEIFDKKNDEHEVIKETQSEVNESVLPTFNETDTEEDTTLIDVNKSECDDEIVMSKVASREQKKSLLKKVFQKSGRRTKNKENIRELRDMLKIILTDSSDNEDVNVSSNDLAKDVTYTSLKPNFFRDSESMNNYYNITSDVSMKESNVAALYPTKENSRTSKSTDSDDNDVTFKGCMCSKVAEKLNQANAKKVGCCCRQFYKKDEETNCDIRNAADYFLLNYKTTEYVDVETQNSRRLTSKVNSYNISIHSTSKRKSYAKPEDIKMLEEVRMTKQVEQKTERESLTLKPTGKEELAEQNKTMKSLISKQESKNISHRRTTAKEPETANMCEKSVTNYQEDLVSEKLAELCTDRSKAESRKSKKSLKSLEEGTDILQSYAAKKAVLEIYAEKTENGDNFVAKLPKFIVEKESEIVKNFEQIANGSYKSVCKENVVVMAIER